MFTFKNVDFVMFKNISGIQRQRKPPWEQILTTLPSLRVWKSEQSKLISVHNSSQFSRLYTLQGNRCQNWKQTSTNKLSSSILTMSFFQLWQWW